MGGKAEDDSCKDVSPGGSKESSGENQDWSRRDYLKQYRSDSTYELQREVWLEKNPYYYKRWREKHPGYDRQQYYTRIARDPEYFRKYRRKNAKHLKKYWREYRRRQRLRKSSVHNKKNC